MTREQCNRIVDRVETRYQGRPEALTRKASAMVFGGYAYLVIVLLLSVCVLVGLGFLVFMAPGAGTVKIALVVGAFAFVLFWSILKAFWVRTPPPVGIPLGRAEAPELFGLLDELRETVADVSFDRVLIDGDFNAAVVQAPRLGIFGWYRSYLILGLPLMQALGPDEFRAVLAHEFAHLSNRDGTSGTWIYRTRRSWEQVIEGIANQGGKGSFALVPFLNWFWPKFNAHAFVLSRLYEFRADAEAARFAGKDATARALQRVELHGRWIADEVWGGIYGKVNHSPEVPGGVFRDVKNGLEQQIDPDRHREWLKQAFLRPTDRSDTHPALKDRLAAFEALPDAVQSGQTPDLLPLPHETASSIFLGDRENGLIEELSRRWAEAMQHLWKVRHEEVQEVRKELGPENDATTADAAWEWATALLDIEGIEAAQPWLQKVLSLEPGHVGARFAQARHFLEKGDSRGVSLLETLMTENEAVGMDALELLRTHYMNTGQTERLEEIDRQADRFEKLYEAANQERSEISHKDTLVPAKLSASELDSCRALFTQESDIRQVHIARKVTRHMENIPLYAIAVTVRTPWLKISSESAFQSLLGRLVEQQPVEGSVLFFINHKNQKKAAKAVAAVEGSLVYAKAKN